MSVNHVPMSPLSLLERTAAVFPTRIAWVYGENRMDYRGFQNRIHRMANGLMDSGLGTGGKVAVLAPNVPMLLEAHFGVPLAGGVLVAINIRLSPMEVAYILDHSGAEVLLVHRDWLPQVREALEKVTGSGVRKIIVDEDPAGHSSDSWRPDDAVGYEEWLEGASDTQPPNPVQDELQPISINYTSGTTGQPKGVVYTHRGAYLNAVSDCMQNGLTRHSVYLWTLPMFHCNGWCFTWAVPAVGGTSICLYQVDPEILRGTIQRESVTHFCGAPVVLNMLATLPDADTFRFETRVRASTGGAPPSPTLLETMDKMNVDAIHLYGLTETYGPNTLCEVQDEWLTLPLADYARKVSRQGVVHPLGGEVVVMDEQMNPVPADGETMGELCMRGNTVMAGYYNDEAATANAFRGGWFHSGDLGVLHPDGYIEIKDRAKDIIISGGENISTIEVENTLAAHPDIAEAAVVSRPDEKWGEVPVAFVSPKPGRELTAEDVIAFCRERLAHFKAPKEVVFQPLPRTSTGKVQKFSLREQMWEGETNRIKGH